MKQIKTNIRVRLPQSVPEAYDFWITADLSLAFTRHIFMPAILGTYPQRSWSRPGKTRTIYFDDTTTARERLLVMVPGFLLRSSITEFDSLFGWLIRELNYECVFSSDPEGRTELAAEFTVVPRNMLSAGLFKLLLERTMAQYLRRSFENVQSIAVGVHGHGSKS